jgi:hypothetical protein
MVRRMASMNVLFVTSRFPERYKRGDQSRAFAYLRFLGARHSLIVVSADRASSPEAAAALEAHCDEVFVANSPAAARLLSALSSLLAGGSAQVGWMMPRKAWREVKRVVPNVDVVVINTVRSLRGPLATPTVIDYVDALSWNMSVRAEGPERLPVRAFAGLEARRLKRWERRVASWAAGAIVTAPDFRELLPGTPPPVAIPVAWDHDVIDERVKGVRDIDLIFTGDMRYPSNREGAISLSREILPRIRETLPRTSCWIVGRYAADLRLPGVVTRSDVPDIGEYLRRAKVAIAPVRGRGSLYKVLEAAAHGAAVVASPWAIAAFGLEAETGHDERTFAEAAVRLLSDEPLREQRAQQGLDAARANSLGTLGPRYETTIIDAARAGRREAARRKNSSGLRIRGK